jgi:hypothetical protein
LARFRLRFLLQEFDLAGPEVLLGRSPDCQITIEDPLVSRRHARIRIDGIEASVADLGSRNGVRVNGRLIDGEAPLNDGDRIRLGTQELVFSVVKARSRDARPTGFMRVCSNCGTPYPEIAPQCPHCGHVEEDDTISGLMVEPKRSWTFQLLGEVIERAIASGRATEADRLMRRAAREVDERMQVGDRLDPNQVAMITGFALRLAALKEDATEWVGWALDVHQKQALMLSSAVLDRLEAIERSPDVLALVSGYLEWWHSEKSSAGPRDLAGLARMEELKIRR